MNELNETILKVLKEEIQPQIVQMSYNMIILTVIILIGIGLLIVLLHKNKKKYSELRRKYNDLKAEYDKLKLQCSSDLKAKYDEKKVTGK